MAWFKLLVMGSKLLQEYDLLYPMTIGRLTTLDSPFKCPGELLISVGYLWKNTKMMNPDSTYGGSPSDPTFPPLGCITSGFDAAISG